MKKILLFIIMLFSSIMVVDATSISNIDMDIFVDNYGNATVVETWDANVTDGTEGYHPYYNLGNSIISNLEVYMDGKEYTTISNWNINSSMYDKAYKAGIYRVDNEVDVCFGISSYGSHRYVIKYNISNFVTTVKDADMIYWNLFPHNFSAEPSNVDITIYSNFKYSDKLDVWGYGKYGAPCYVYDGKIEMTSDNSRVTSDEYMTILVKFPKGTFNTSNILDNDFNYYLDMAEEGATNYNDEPEPWWIWLIALIPIIFNVLLFGFIFGFAVNSSRNDKCTFGKTGNKVRKDVLPFRDIPCDKDIFYAYWVAYNYNLTKKKEDFLGAVLLKWIHDGNVRIEKVNKDGVFKDKVLTNIVFCNRPTNSNVYEGSLYDYMYDASKDGKLEQDEFKKWCSNNYKKILGWFDKILINVRSNLYNQGKIKIVEGKDFGIFKYTSYEVDPSMMEVAEQMAGLKKFLKEFSIIDKREPIEVNLWNEYLMYAQIFGIAEEVASQFKKLYPEVIADMDSIGYDYSDVMFIRSITYSGIRSASTARSRAESYSSGGGGFSSGGGGGGSFGGGGGGGGFR